MQRITEMNSTREESTSSVPYLKIKIQILFLAYLIACPRHDFFFHQICCCL